jgi:glucosylceramidase
VAAANADVTVNDAATAQTWEGFGGAFNEMGWNTLSMLSDGRQGHRPPPPVRRRRRALRVGRIPIGASDYAMSRYTLDEAAGDTSLASFSIDRDLEQLIPFVKAAQAVKA